MEGPFFEFGEFTLHPFQPGVLEDYQPKDDFPNCCPFHKSVFEQAKEYALKFPNCCENHKTFAQQSYFDSRYYQNLETGIIYRLSFTEHHVGSQIDNIDWYEDITDYIEYIIMSFGTPPVGVHIYLNALNHFIEAFKETMGERKAQKLLDYIDNLNKPGTVVIEDIDLNALHAIYQKWLGVFPFDILPFSDLKEHFTNQFPIFSEKPVVNRYTNLMKGKATTKKEMVVYLVSQTKELLRMVKSAELINNGTITEVEARAIELTNENHRVKQVALLEQFSNDESQYVAIIKGWLENEKEYFKEISPLLANRLNEAKRSSVGATNKNVFNKMPLEQVENWFMQLAINTSSTGSSFLTADQVRLFIERAFEGKHETPKQMLNYGPKEKLTVWKLFYQYYQRCISIDNGIERTTQCRDKYIKLLTDNFTNFTFDEVKTNFSKSNQVRKDWNLPM